jgi:hypothetical protein
LQRMVPHDATAFNSQHHLLLDACNAMSRGRRL